MGGARGGRGGGGEDAGGVKVGKVRRWEMGEGESTRRGRGRGREGEGEDEDENKARLFFFLKHLSHLFSIFLFTCAERFIFHV